MGINISLTAGPDGSSSRVSASGEVVDIIPDAERSTFKLSDSQLKGYVNSYFGRAPNDAYLKGPTPWNDLYATYGWSQVKRVMRVQSAEILGITSEPVIVKSQDFVNTSSRQGTFNVGIDEQVTNSASSNWSTGGTFKIEQKFIYKVGFLGTEAGGETSIGYEQSWGIGGEQSKSVTIGSSSGVTVVLDPGQAVTTVLSASRGVMRVRIRYVAYLEGLAAINYNPTYRNHHFWGLNIGSVMGAGGVANSVTSTEDIEIGYYSNSKIELKDKVTGAVTCTYCLDDLAGNPQNVVI